MGGVAENLRGDPCGTDAAPPPPPNPDPWVRGHPFWDFMSSPLVRGPAFLNPLVVAPFSLLLQISMGIIPKLQNAKCIFQNLILGSLTPWASAIL